MKPQKIRLIPYAGYEAPNRKKKKVRPEKRHRPQPSRARIDFVLTYNPTYFSKDQMDQLPGMPDSLKKLLIEVCLKCAITPNTLVGLGRNKAISNARELFVKRAKDELGASFPRIARAIKRDHTTCIYAYHGRKRWKDPPAVQPT